MRVRACVRACMCTTHMKTGASQSLTTRQSWLHVLAVSPDLAEEVGITKGSYETQRISLERQQELQTADVPFHPLQHTYRMSKTDVAYCNTHTLCHNRMFPTATDIRCVTNGCCLLQQTLCHKRLYPAATNRHRVTNGCCLLQQTHTVSQTAVAYFNRHTLRHKRLFLSLIHISEPTRHA